MPFTFLPHQVPVLPLAAGDGARVHDRWDGLALVAGSVAPDLFYVTVGWSKGPWGIDLSTDGHSVANLPRVVVLACLLATVVRRVVLSVLPLAVPDGGQFHFHDYWAISRRRHRWYVTAYSALVGAVTHLVLDSFTHVNGFVVEHIDVMRRPWVLVSGKPVGFYTVLQYGGSVLGGVWALYLLRRMGRARHFRRRIDDQQPPLGRAPAAAVSAGVLLGVVGGVGSAMRRNVSHRGAGLLFESNKSTVIMAFCWVAFVGLVVGCAVANWLNTTPRLRKNVPPSGMVFR